MSPVAFHIPGDAPDTDAALLYPADATARRDTLFVLAHGAGAGHASPWIVRYARALAARGLDVVTFNFPYMQARRSAPDRAPVLEDAFRRVVAAAAAHRQVHASRLLIGGKSMGGRMATHLAAAPDSWPETGPRPHGVVVFGYPLRPPGGPSRTSPDRVSHLAKMAVPALIVQGTRDNFGSPDDIRAALADHHPLNAIAIHAVEGGDHSLAVRKSAGRAQATVDAEIWDAVIGFASGRAG